MIEPPPARRSGNTKLATEEDTFQIDGDRFLPNRLARIDRVVVPIQHDARIIEEDVELAECLFGRRDHCLAVGPLGNVGVNVKGATPLFLHQRDGLFAGRIVHVDRNDCGPFTAEEKG